MCGGFVVRCNRRCSGPNRAEMRFSERASCVPASPARTPLVSRCHRVVGCSQTRLVCSGRHATRGSGPPGWGHHYARSLPRAQRPPPRQQQRGGPEATPHSPLRRRQRGGGGCVAARVRTRSPTPLAGQRRRAAPPPLVRAGEDTSDKSDKYTDVMQERMGSAHLVYRHVSGRAGVAGGRANRGARHHSAGHTVPITHTHAGGWHELHAHPGRPHRGVVPADAGRRRRDRRARGRAHRDVPAGGHGHGILFAGRRAHPGKGAPRRGKMHRRACRVVACLLPRACPEHLGGHPRPPIAAAAAATAGALRRARRRGPRAPPHPRL